MPKTAMIRARIEPALKEDAEKIFHELGINATEAISMFYAQVRLRKGIPFEINIPNDETIRSIKDARSGKGKRFNSLDALIKDLKS